MDLDRYHDLIRKADDASREALDGIKLARGSERPGIAATMATMWVTLARHEHDKLIAKALNAKLAFFTRRLAANNIRLDAHNERLERLEKQLKLSSPAEPSTPLDYDPADDDDYDLLDDLEDDTDEPPFFFVPLANGGAVLVPENDN